MERPVTAPSPGRDGLASRVALVTGASRGIGRATAETLAEAGASVAVHYSRRRDEAEALVRQLEASGVRAAAYAADFRQPGSAEALVARVEDDFGRIDILVNNAATLHVATTESTSEQDWNETIQIDLTAPFHCIQRVLPGMRERGSGSVVNVASIAALNGGAMGPAYAAAKGGLVAMTRYLARDCIKFGIRVNCVAPTLTDTDLLREPGVSALTPRILATNPMGRLALPTEIARAIRFLASDEASFVNGECLMVTGGP
jgi:NAD(P)-dependent dehydrogenase (short-subunit alcohol dehydrogenase family)